MAEEFVRLCEQRVEKLHQDPFVSMCSKCPLNSSILNFYALLFPQARRRVCFEHLLKFFVDLQVGTKAVDDDVQEQVQYLCRMCTFPTRPSIRRRLFIQDTTD